MNRQRYARKPRVLTLALSAIALAGVLVPLPACRRQPAKAVRAAAPKWQCPMHPQVVSDKPGECPICRMELVAVTPAPAAGTSASLPAAATPVAEIGGRKVLYWYDPMSPGSRFDKPGKSPFMDMQLVPKYADEVGAPESGGPAARAAAPSVSLSAAQMRATGVATIAVTRQQLSHGIRAVGTIEPDETRLERVAARVPGRVERLYADFTGQQVRRGAPLYSLYSPDLVATQREYLLALENLRRLQASPEAADPAGKLLQATRDRLRLWGIGEAQIQELERTGRPQLTSTFVSPISGTVLQKSVIEGQYVQEGTELYLLADLSSVWLVAQVYEYELGRLAMGQTAEVTVSGYPGRVFPGSVAFIEPVLDRETRTARVRVVLPNPGGVLKPGMFANALLQVDLGKQLSVPRSAVIDTGARQVAYVETSPGVFTPRDVKLGSSAGDRVAVLQGLKEGEMVVAAANFFIDSQSQLSGGASVQWSGALEVKEQPTPRSRR